MKVYKVTRYSDCGTYFGSYLKSVTVLANSEGEAKKLALAWTQERRNPEFLDDKVCVEELCEVDGCGVIDWDSSADY